MSGSWSAASASTARRLLCLLVPAVDGKGTYMPSTANVPVTTIRALSLTYSITPA